MRRYQAAITGGLIAGMVTTAVMVAGRKTGVLAKTLDRDAVDWIDNLTGSRAVIGDGALRERIAAGGSIAMPAEAIAEAIAYAISQPAGVNVGEIVIRPTAQA